MTSYSFHKIAPHLGPWCSRVQDPHRQVFQGRKHRLLPPQCCICQTICIRCKSTCHRTGAGGWSWQTAVSTLSSEVKSSSAFVQSIVQLASNTLRASAGDKLITCLHCWPGALILSQTAHRLWGSVG